SQPADIIRDFHQRGGQSFQCALRKDDLVMRGKSGELVGMRAKGKSGELEDFFRGTLSKFGMGVEPGADCSTTDRQVVKPVQGLFQPLDVALEQAGPPPKLLTDGERHGIL